MVVRDDQYVCSGCCGRVAELGVVMILGELCNFAGAYAGPTATIDL